MKVLSVIGTIGKIVGFLFIGLIVLFIVFILIMMMITKSNNAYKGDYKTTVKNDDSSAPEALVIYQPSKSDSKKIADQLAKGLNESGYEVTITYPGKHVSEEISQYSLLAFGSPVYFGKPSENLTKTISRMKDLTDKKVILYSVGKLTDAPEFEEVKKSLNGKEPDYSVKFSTKDNVEKQAYDMGIKVGKESREGK